MARNRLARIKSLIAEQLTEFLEIPAPEQAAETTRPSHEDTLEDLRARLGRALVERYRLSKAFASADFHPDYLNDLARQALEAGREDLARAALAEKSGRSANLARNRQQLDLLKDEILTIEALITDLDEGPRVGSRERLRDLDQRIAALHDGLMGEQ
ncbi:MAG: hypothetical protein AAFY84_07930 [Pseudomonadota bacterium]